MHDQLSATWNLNNGTGNINASGIPAITLSYAIGFAIGAGIYILAHKYNLIPINNQSNTNLAITSNP